MTTQELLSTFESLGNEKTREINRKHGAGDNQFGVHLAEIRNIAKKIKKNHELGLELWATGNVEAMLLATLILKPKELTRDEIDRMAHEITYFKVADWFNDYLIRLTNHVDSLRVTWIQDPHECSGRMGWSLTAWRISKGITEGIDPVALLDQIENELAVTSFRRQETMNYCLVQISVQYEELRARGLEIAERLGVFRDYPVPKGCTSPFAPVWIDYILTH